MDSTIAATLPHRPRGRVTTLLLAELAFGGPRLAWQLALTAGIKSNQVYPLLRYWIDRGVVEAKRLGSLNLYQVRSEAVKGLQKVLEALGKGRTYASIRRALAVIMKRLGRKLNELEEELISLLVERLAANTSPYLRIRGDTPQAAFDILASKLEARLRRRGLDPTRIAQLLANLEEIVETLNEEGIIYFFWDKRNHHLVLRIDQSLDNAVHADTTTTT